MDETIKDIKKDAGRMVHEFSAHSYFVYLIAIVVGLGLDQFYPVIVTLPVLNEVGTFLVLVGTFFVFWAMRSSHKTIGVRHGGESGQDEVHANHFHVGAYCVTRAPTQFGLFLMTLGLGFIFNSVYMIALAIIAFIISRFVFVPKKEENLLKKYGQSFSDYKKKVRF